MAMEIYYLTESVMTATPATDREGEVHTYIHGKGDELLFAETPDGYINRNHLTPYFVREYGYRRESDARRNWSFKHPENNYAWRTESSIIRVLVRKDNKVVFLP